MKTVIKIAIAVSITAAASFSFANSCNNQSKGSLTRIKSNVLYLQTKGGSSQVKEEKVYPGTH
ncbi:MAG: hypothetical protein ACXVCY_11710 [Pseudobdellovibrionaceae bacterium]